MGIIVYYTMSSRACNLSDLRAATQHYSYLDAPSSALLRKSERNKFFPRFFYFL